ncbi:hypothetical protein [Nocardia sp. NPDC057227]|uniref:hypothetical protein n=1 Tax=Nocardia sp. NPDC057227 TaxID=3346056 RepID=UPI003636702D
MVAPDIPAILDTDTVTAVREILDEPALPVDTTVTGPGGARAAALREVIDHLVTVRALAAAARSAADGERLLAELRSLGTELAEILAPHVALAGVLGGLPAGRAADAVVGDVGRGAVLTGVRAVRGWEWQDDHVPDAVRPLGAVDAELVLPDFPGLFDHVVVPVSGALVVVPTHRDRITWEPVEPGAGGSRTEWLVRLYRVTVHVDEIVPFDGLLPVETAGSAALADAPAGAPLS